MANKIKLQGLLDKLKNLEGSLPLSDTQTYLDQVVKQESDKFAASFKENATVKYLDGFNTKLEQFKRDFNLEPIISAIENMQGDISTTQQNATKEFGRVSQAQDAKYNELVNLVQSTRGGLEKMSSQGMASLLSRVDDLQSQLSYQSKDSSQKGQSLNSVIGSLEKRMEDAFSALKDETVGRDTLSKSTETKFKDEEASIAVVVASIEALRKEMNRLFSTGRGGAINRQMFIGGADPLKTYTDMNLKAGSNVTITYANNNTTKKVDVTFASSGGGGGSTRSINSVAINTAAGSTAGTDYVYLVTGTTTITMPTAVGNTNLYTIKNVGTGVVTIATTSAQTIDGATTIVMPVQYTAVDLISDTANWNVT